MDTLFDKKKTYTDTFGEELIDLSLPSVKYNNIEANGYYRVSQDQKGRIDKFTWNAVSSDLNAIDMVMYFNHIYNPFSIDEGDFLYAPVYDSNKFLTYSEPELPDGTKHSSNTSGGKSLTYAEKVELAARKGLGVK